MARKGKYTPELVAELTRALSFGATQKDACAHVDISHQTFHRWLNTKGEFREAVTRAEGQARFAATLAIRKAVQGAEQTTTHTETITETRLHKVKDKETGAIVEAPYEYKKTTHGTTVIQYPPDWRAAVEYLKRRDPEQWSDRLKVDDWRSQAIADIKAGRIQYEALAEAFDDSLAAELFRAAGIPVSLGEGPPAE